MCCGCWCIDPQPMLCVWHVYYTYNVMWMVVHRPTAHAVRVACVLYIPCGVGVGASTHSPCCVCVACVPYMPCAVGVGASIHSPCCTSGMCTIHTMYFGRWCIDPQPILCMWHVCHTYHVLWALVHRPTAHAVCVACVPYIPCAVGVGAWTHSPCCVFGMCAIHTMCCGY